MTVHLHIDRLVLDGLGPLDGDAVGAAVQAELARLFTGARVPDIDTSPRPHLDGGAFDLGGDANRIGQEVARSLHTTLTHKPANP